MKQQKFNKSLVALTTMSFLLANGCGNNPTSADKQKAADLIASQAKDAEARKNLFAQSLLSVGYDFDATKKSISLYMSHTIDGNQVDIPNLLGTLGNTTKSKVKNPETKAYLTSSDPSNLEYSAAVACLNLVTDSTCDNSVIEITKASGPMASTVFIEHHSMSLDNVVATEGAPGTPGTGTPTTTNTLTGTLTGTGSGTTTTTGTSTATASATSTGQTFANIQATFTDSGLTATTSTASIDTVRGGNQLFELEVTFNTADQTFIRKALFVGMIGNAGKIAVTFTTSAKDSTGAVIAPTTDTLTGDATFDATKNLLTLSFGNNLSIAAQPIAPPAAK